MTFLDNGFPNFEFVSRRWWSQIQAWFLQFLLFFWKTRMGYGMPGDICPGCSATDMGEATWPTQSLSSPDTDERYVNSGFWRSAHPINQPEFAWTLLTGHQLQRRATSLPPQHSNVDFALLLYPSHHQHQAKRITFNPFTWHKASRET